jgi:hypothetical protein
MCSNAHNALQTPIHIVSAAAMPVQKAQNPNTTPSQKIIPTVSFRVEVGNEFCVAVEIY